jgi:hypothetical protein
MVRTAAVHFCCCNWMTEIDGWCECHFSLHQLLLLLLLLLLLFHWTVKVAIAKVRWMQAAPWELSGVPSSAVVEGQEEEETYA